MIYDIFNLLWIRDCPNAYWTKDDSYIDRFPSYTINDSAACWFTNMTMYDFEKHFHGLTLLPIEDYVLRITAVI